MQALILAGGFGTRLRALLEDTPKPMAPIQGKPFLAHLITYLQQQGVTEVVLSVHYLRKQIENYFQDHYQDVAIRYVIEDAPLGTGGAIKNAIKVMQITQPFFVLNGDTFLKLNYRAMLEAHRARGAQITLALHKTSDCGRYGAVTVQNNIIASFKEKTAQGSGWINAGIYLIHPEILLGITEQMFAFEKDFLVPNLRTLKPRAFCVNDYFIDIGTPEDYHRATLELLPQIE